MTITFISTFQALIWLLTAIGALSLYMWKVRPYLAQRPEFHQWYTLADSYWARWWAWLKIRWDLTVAALVMAAPSLWNGALDAGIWLSITLADAIPVLAGMDLSALLLPSWVETAIRLGGGLIPIIRARFMDKGGE